MKKLVLLLAAAGALSLAAQTNTWTRVTGNQVGDRSFPALAYVPAGNSFIYTMGDQSDNGQETAPAVSLG